MTDESETKSAEPEAPLETDDLVDAAKKIQAHSSNNSKFI